LKKKRNKKVVNGTETELKGRSLEGVGEKKDNKKQCGGEGTSRNPGEEQREAQIDDRSRESINKFGETSRRKAGDHVGKKRGRKARLKKVSPNNKSGREERSSDIKGFPFIRKGPT